MKSIRSSHELFDYLDRDISWRRREIIELENLVLRSRASKVNVHIRSGITLLYAHWEGFIKSAANTYISYINSKNIPTNKLTDCLIALSIKTIVTGLEGAKKSTQSLAIVNQVVSNADKPISFQSNSISADSNLNSDVFKNIANWIGIDIEKYSTRFALIDESLLANRNKIAHGEFLAIDSDRYQNLAQEIFEMMEWFKTDIENAVAQRSYLRAA